MLSPRGTIIQDARRNALIVTDLPAQFGRVDQLVRFLDTAAQQVEIEARSAIGKQVVLEGNR